MSDMDINQVLTQMRVLAARAEGGADGPSAVDNGNFSKLLSESLDKVSTAQNDAGALKQAFEMGEQGVELPEVMVALQKANVSFQAITQVRNKLLNAYQEIMNMQV